MTAAASAADEIEAALDGIATELEAGNVVSAGALVEGLIASCRAAEGRGLEPGQAIRLRALLGRCEELANSTSGKLNASLHRFSVSDRARKAYGDR